IACLGLTTGAVIGARLVKFPWRQSLAMGFGLNARGAMEIVLALLALQYGVIGERLFIALVVMALATSLIAGPLMQWALKRKQPVTLRQYLHAKTLVPNIVSGTQRGVNNRLAEAAQHVTDIDAGHLADRVWDRELTMGTALPGGLAIPHARIAQLDKPVV